MREALYIMADSPYFLGRKPPRSTQWSVERNNRHHKGVESFRNPLMDEFFRK